jgi:hypothetical protein
MPKNLVPWMSRIPSTQHFPSSSSSNKPAAHINSHWLATTFSPRETSRYDDNEQFPEVTAYKMLVLLASFHPSATCPSVRAEFSDVVRVQRGSAGCGLGGGTDYGNDMRMLVTTVLWKGHNDGMNMRYSDQHGQGLAFVKIVHVVASIGKQTKSWVQVSIGVMAQSSFPSASSALSSLVEGEAKTR